MPGSDADALTAPPYDDHFAVREKTFVVHESACSKDLVVNMNQGQQEVAHEEKAKVQARRQITNRTAGQPRDISRSYGMTTRANPI